MPYEFKPVKRFGDYKDLPDEYKGFQIEKIKERNQIIQESAEEIYEQLYEALIKEYKELDIEMINVVIRKDTVGVVIEIVDPDKK